MKGETKRWLEKSNQDMNIAQYNFDGGKLDYCKDISPYYTVTRISSFRTSHRQRRNN